jgi:hypothetical protein
MRALADATRIHQFMKALGREADRPARVYFTGGATAVLHGWRTSTIAIDMKMVPDLDRVFRAIPEIKERLQINVELASPDDFIPVREGWQDRSPFIGREGPLDFHHFDLYAQGLSKIERGHAQDLADVRELFERGLIEPVKLLEYFAAIEPRLYRYPAIDSKNFRRGVEDALRAHG